jgi:hypothetical protein
MIIFTNIKNLEAINLKIKIMTNRDKTIARYKREFTRDSVFIGLNNPFRKSLKHDIYQEFIDKKFYRNLKHCGQGIKGLGIGLIMLFISLSSFGQKVSKLDSLIIMKFEMEQKVIDYNRLAFLQKQPDYDSIVARMKKLIEEDNYRNLKHLNDLNEEVLKRILERKQHSDSVKAVEDKRVKDFADSLRNKSKTMPKIEEKKRWVMKHY